MLLHDGQIPVGALLTPNMRFWEDIAVGERATSRLFLADKKAMKSFAEEFDPLPELLGDADANQTKPEDLVASRFYAMALWRKLHVEINRSVALINIVSIKRLDWPVPLRAGDSVYAQSTCVAKRLSIHEPLTGFITSKHLLQFPDGRAVLSFEGSTQVRRRSQHLIDWS